jgi:hypothetical protein
VSAAPESALTDSGGGSRLIDSAILSGLASLAVLADEVEAEAQAAALQSPATHRLLRVASDVSAMPNSGSAQSSPGAGSPFDVRRRSLPLKVPCLCGGLMQRGTPRGAAQLGCSCGKSPAKPRRRPARLRPPRPRNSALLSPVSGGGGAAAAEAAEATVPPVLPLASLPPRIAKPNAGAGGGGAGKCAASVGTESGTGGSDKENDESAASRCGDSNATAGDNRPDARSAPGRRGLHALNTAEDEAHMQFALDL